LAYRIVNKYNDNVILLSVLSREQYLFLKNVIFWNAKPCGSCRRFVGKYQSVLRLPVTANVVLISPILATLFMDEIRFS
jgi:hypothetical protein